MIQIDSVVIAVGNKKEDEVMTLSFDKVIEASKDKRLKRRKTGMEMIYSNRLYEILDIDRTKLEKGGSSYLYKIGANDVNWVGYIPLNFTNIDDALKYSKIYIKNGIAMTLSELVVYLKMTGEKTPSFSYEIPFTTRDWFSKFTLFLDCDSFDNITNFRIFWDIHIPLNREIGH